MQIISGKYRGRKLMLPVKARPTQNRARIALFNMLKEILNVGEITVWDAFAGSGAFGIEFLSRGWARHAIFTDSDADAIKVIGKNLSGFSADEFVIRHSDALRVSNEFGLLADVVFIDPPYSNLVVAEKLIDKLKPGAIIVWEMESCQEPKIGYEILKDKTYGRARFLIMVKK